MLINTRESNGFTDVRKHKSGYWEKRNLTPNEAAYSDVPYRCLLKQFKKLENVTSANRFFEVRIVKQKPSHLMIHPSTHWWDQPGLMDHVFWVFQTPIFANKPGDEPYGVYILEPMECKRIARILSERFQVPEPVYPGCFILPVEITQLAWTETANGYSEHIHHREEHIPTEQELTIKEERKVAYDKMVEDAASDSRLQKAMSDAVDKVQSKIQKKLIESGNTDSNRN